MKVLAPEGCNAFDQEPHLRNKPDSVNEVGYTPEGWLNEYSLHCGYTEQISAHNRWLSLWYEGCWHVRAYDFDLHHRLYWESFDTLNDARKFYASAALMLNFR